MECWERLGVEAAEREKLEENTQEGLAEQVKMRDILAVFGKDVWKRTALGVFLMGMQQLSGIDGVLYVSDLLIFLTLLITTVCTTSVPIRRVDV